jgi:hypothetical protein
MRPKSGTGGGRFGFSVDTPTPTHQLKRLWNTSSGVNALFKNLLCMSNDGLFGTALGMVGSIWMTFKND